MRARWVLSIWSALAVAVGLTVVVDDVLDRRTGAGDQVVGGGTTSTGDPSGADAPGSVPPDAPLRPGQTRVTGTVTALHAEDAVLQPRSLPTPLTVVSERGFGNGAEITGVTVDGEPATIVWDAGRPLVIEAVGDGEGAVVLDPVTLDVVPGEGVRLLLAGAVHGFWPGTYRVDTPVAVGRQGIATPRDSVTFTADEQSDLSATGRASVVLAGEPVHFIGPGLLQLDGTLEVTTVDGTATVGRLDAPLAELDVTLTELDGGAWRIDALIEGAVTTA